MTVELPVFQQGDKTYCEDCKPRGTSRKSTLVISGSTVCCSGCGESFKDMGLLALNEQYAAQDWQEEAFYSLMAEAQ